jgi:hypothetical protein
MTELMPFASSALLSVKPALQPLSAPSASITTTLAATAAAFTSVLKFYWKPARKDPPVQTAVTTVSPVTRTGTA